MASPHYNGIDERNGFLPVVDTVTDLQAQSGGYPGREVFVNSLRRSFILDPFSADTVDGATVIACISGGQWRLQGQTLADIMLAARGILAETLPLTGGFANLVTISGTAYFTMIPLRAGMTVANITIAVGVVGVSVTLSKVGLFSLAGVQLAVSADQGTNWQSTGLKTIAMAVPYVVPTSGGYYVGIINVAGTGAALTRGSAGFSGGATGLNAAIGAGALPWGLQTGQSDMPSPATIIASTANLAESLWSAIT